MTKAEVHEWAALAVSAVLSRCFRAVEVERALIVLKLTAAVRQALARER